jgi:hypothetical protein
MQKQPARQPFFSAPNGRTGRIIVIVGMKAALAAHLAIRRALQIGNAGSKKSNARNCVIT